MSLPDLQKSVNRGRCQHALLMYATAIQTSIALLLAFVVAPFGHVHSGHGPDHDHAQVHAHFFHLSKALHSRLQLSGIQLEADDDEDDDHAAVSSVDTFTLVLNAALAPFVLPRGPLFFCSLRKNFEPVRPIEERGHDPPARSRAKPRAPPA